MHVVTPSIYFVPPGISRCRGLSAALHCPFDEKIESFVRQRKDPPNCLGICGSAHRTLSPSSCQPRHRFGGCVTVELYISGSWFLPASCYFASVLRQKVVQERPVAIRLLVSCAQVDRIRGSPSAEKRKILGMVSLSYCCSVSRPTSTPPSYFDHLLVDLPASPALIPI